MKILEIDDATTLELKLTEEGEKREAQLRELARVEDLFFSDEEERDALFEPLIKTIVADIKDFKESEDFESNFWQEQTEVTKGKLLECGTEFYEKCSRFFPYRNEFSYDFCQVLKKYEGMESREYDSMFLKNEALEVSDLAPFLTVAQLNELLSLKGLKVKGKKDALVEALCASGISSQEVHDKLKGLNFYKVDPGLFTSSELQMISVALRYADEKWQQIMDTLIRKDVASEDEDEEGPSVVENMFRFLGQEYKKLTIPSTLEHLGIVDLCQAVYSLPEENALAFVARNDNEGLKSNLRKNIKSEFSDWYMGEVNLPHAVICYVLVYEEESYLP